MGRQYDAADEQSIRVAGLLYQMNAHMEGMAELHDAVAEAVADGSRHIPRRVVVFQQPVVEAQVELGAMIAQAAQLREALEHIQEAHHAELIRHYPSASEEEILAMSNLGCMPVLKAVATLERAYGDLALPPPASEILPAREVSGITVTHTAQGKSPGRG